MSEKEDPFGKSLLLPRSPSKEITGDAASNNTGVQNNSEEASHEKDVPMLECLKQQNTDLQEQNESLTKEISKLNAQIAKLSVDIAKLASSSNKSQFPDTTR